MVDRPASPAALQQRLLRRFALLAFGYWRGPTRFKAWGFTVGLFLALLLNLAVAVAVNGWNKLFFDALQYKNEQRLVFSIFLVLVLAALSALTVALLQQVRMRLQLRWREWLTKTLVRRWMDRRRFYQLSILDLVDNPEARMAEDGRLAIELFVDFTAGVTNAVLTAASFVGVLWFIGGSLTMWGVEIPGYLVIAAILYSGVTSFGMLLIGRPLVARVEEKAAAEADFRYELTRTRENAETIALIGGDDDERVKLDGSFDALALRWVSVIGRQTRMIFLAGANNVLAPVIPLLLGAPKYLAGEISLGDLMQAAAAFTQVQNALNWLSDNSLRLADWFASARRVAALDSAFTQLDKLAEGPEGHAIDLGFSEDGALHLRGLAFARVLLKRPDIIIMDEPTSALDELSQTRMMELLRAEVPDSMVLHVAHRPGLDRFHDREIHLKREPGHPATVEETPADIWLAGRRWLAKIGAGER